MLLRINSSLLCHCLHFLIPYVRLPSNKQLKGAKLFNLGHFYPSDSQRSSRPFIIMKKKKKHGMAKRRGGTGGPKMPAARDEK